MDLGWHLGDVVRKLRDAKGWSQTHLGKKAGGMSKNTIVRLENDGPMAVDTKTIDRVARALGLEMTDLYALIPRRKEPPSADRLPRPAGSFRQGEYIGPDERKEDLGAPPGVANERGRGRRSV